VNRQDLLQKLELVKPALSSINLVPVLTHFWFRDNSLICFNDQIAIKTKLVSNFVGAIPDTLTSLLSVSKAKEVEFFVGKDADGKALPEGQLLVKAASSKLKLPFMEEKYTKIFEMPKPNKEDALPVDMAAFLEAIDLCTRSLKEDTSMPDSLGITLVFESDYVELYATNDATISYARVKIRGKFNDKLQRVIISGHFCRQMLSLAKLEGTKHIEIGAGYSLFQCGDNYLFGKLVDVQRPLDFDAVIESTFPVALHKNLVSIPSKLELILDRAVIITESKTERSKTEITVSDGIAKFFSQSEKGEVRDTMQVEEFHPEVSVSIDPRLFKNGFGHFDKMLLTETCLVMSKGTSLYLVSASQ
jgi:DNA polymerase III sliding clamp (beta) subunit (PCNA family)